MKINPVQVTRIIPLEEFGAHPYKDLAEMGCSHIRERLLKDGSRILMGYKDSQKIANLTQKISSFGNLDRIAFYDVDVYGPQKNFKEVSSDKAWYNKIGDVLKTKYQVKNYENNKLVKEQQVNFDIIEGLDESKTKYTIHNTDNKTKNVGLIYKHRISEAEYVEETYSKNGDFLSREVKTVDDKEGMWKY